MYSDNKSSQSAFTQDQISLSSVLFQWLCSVCCPGSYLRDVPGVFLLLLLPLDVSILRLAFVIGENVPTPLPG
jgi:hypothetical protein